MRPQAKHRFAVVGLALFFMSAVIGCTAGQNFHAPDVSMTMEDNWQAVSSGAEGQLDQHRQPVTDWWRQFHDDALSGLVDQLFSSNRALAGAKQRILELSARQGVVQADSKLQLAAALDYTHAEAGDKAVSILGPPPL